MLHDSLKPPKDVAAALDLLVDNLLTGVKKAPVSPDDLLARLNANPPPYLAAVKDYMRRTGFLDGEEFGKSALYHVLQINLQTGKGSRVLLSGSAARFALRYFPGYTRETPLIQFLMQEMTDYPLTKIHIRPKDRWITKGSLVMHPREAAVGRLLAGIREEKAMYERESRTKLDTLPRYLTIGGFLGLPQEVIGSEKYAAIYTVYGLLRQHGFSSDIRLALR